MSAAKSYGEALFEFAIEERIEDVVIDDLNGLLELFDEHSDYIKILDSPQIERNELMKILNEDFFGKVNHYTLNFLKLLCEKHMVHKFADCFDIYKKLYNKHRNIHEVRVTTARPLSESITQTLKEKLTSKIGGEIVLKKHIDEGCIGGIIIEADGKRIDSSLKTELTNIRQALVK